jgi:predicted HicB family RNase H-like nuclease
MKNILRYKDFIGSVQFSDADEIFYGKVTGIDDLVSFEGSSVNDLKTDFIEAVEDYLDLCKKIDKDPYKSYKGSLNVRIGSELHKKAAQNAAMHGITLNQYIQKAISKEVNEEGEPYSVDKSKN